MNILCRIIGHKYTREHRRDGVYEVCNRCARTVYCPYLRFLMSTPNHEVGHDKGFNIDSENKNIGRNKTNNMTWNTAESKGVTFTTPKGNYCPQTDDLVAEIKAAARFAGLKHPIVKVGNDVIDNPEDLDTDSISELVDGTVVSVSAYDIAG